MRATPPAGSAHYGEWYSDRYLDERQRLDLLAEVFDEATSSALSKVGIQPNWQCVDVGGGRGSIATWIAERACGGRTFVLDRDPDVRAPTVPRSVSYLNFDVSTNQLAEQSFDLVHSRFLLQHLAEREEVLDRMLSWVAPGGWIVLGDAFDIAEGSPTHPDFAAFHTALHAVLPTFLSTDFSWGRRYPQPLVQRGLVDIECEVFTPILRGGDNPFALMLASSFERLRPALVENGTDESLINATLKNLADPDFWDFEFALVTTWGRKPSEGSPA